MRHQSGNGARSGSRRPALGLEDDRATRPARWRSRLARERPPECSLEARHEIADLARTRTGPLDPRRPGGRSHAQAGIVRNPLAYPRVNGETRRALAPAISVCDLQAEGHAPLIIASERERSLHPRQAAELPPRVRGYSPAMSGS